MKKYILDASIFLKAILNEDEKEARLVEKVFLEVSKKKAIVYAPTFILLEFTNGLRFSLNDESLVILSLEKFFQLPIELFSFKTIHVKEILKLSFRLQTTVYDTAYHFLAKLLNGIFLTADEEYFKKAKRLGDIVLA